MVKKGFDDMGVEDTAILVVIMVMVAILLMVTIKLLFDKKTINTVENTIRGMGFEQKIGEIKSYNDGMKEQYFRLQTEMERNVGEIKRFASDVRQDYRSLDTLLRVPNQRGALGEISLETILDDQLSPEFFGIREKIFGKIPDAHIRSIVGTICVDSKFPLDNYRLMVETDVDEEREMYKKAFLKNIRGHLGKIKEDYIRPDLGTTEFAFAYIPSEAVFYFLINEMYDELLKWTKDGVHVTRHFCSLPRFPSMIFHLSFSIRFYHLPGHISRTKLPLMEN